MSETFIEPCKTVSFVHTYVTKLINWDQVQKLDEVLSNGFNPNSSDCNRKTLLLYACERNRINSIRLLLQYGVNPDICDNTGNYPLIESTLNEYTECFTLLLEYADADISNIKCETALSIACRYEYTHLIDLLLLYGANANIADTTGLPLFTGLHVIDDKRMYFQH
jgi:ankyrin repeat protein